MTEIVLKILATAVLAAIVWGQYCVEETLDCNQDVPLILKLGNVSCACDRTEHAGALKYSNGLVSICSGSSNWSVVLFKWIYDYGTIRNPASSCKDIRDKAVEKQLTDGVYWLRFSESPLSVPFPVYCDMTAGGWTLVFKAVSGVDNNATSALDVYQNNTPTEEFQTVALNVTNQHKKHYMNRLATHSAWSSPSKVRVSLYKNGSAVKELLFRGSASTRDSWFSADRLLISPWIDIKTEPKNYFSIQGHCTPSKSPCRSFFMSRRYSDCVEDTGWLMITDGPWCDWEKAPFHFKKIIYSKGDNYAHWSNKEEVGVADVLAVFVM